MSLFHPRVLKKHVKQRQPASGEQQDILLSWSENLKKGLYDSETKNDGQFIEQILVRLLGYAQSGSSPEQWTLVKNQPIGAGNVDAAIGRFSINEESIIAPFELKGAKTHDLDAVMPGRGKTPVQQVWEYVMDAKGAKWALLSNFREIRLYAVGYGRKDYERFDLTEPFGNYNYEKMSLLLSADNLLDGTTEAILKESDRVEKEITDSLYIDYKTIRSRLIAEISAMLPKEKALTAVNVSQTILDRILFVAFAEDRGLLPKETLRTTFEANNPYSPQPVWNNFKGLFQAIDKGNPPLKIPGYNGGLFSFDPEIDKLSLDDDLCGAFNLLGSYDFDSEVSVNILGHIFEQSITDLEEIKHSAVGAPLPEKSKRKKDGVYYTPPHVTRYIVEQALGGWLAERKLEIGFEELPTLTDDDYASIAIVKSGKNAGSLRYNKNVEAHIKAWEAYDVVVRNVKVLDPACGSGAFLNEVFDYLYREGQAINSQLTTLRGGQLHLFRWDKHILQNNIFGVDVNPESVEITKLSLWLKTANRAEKLTYLEDCIKCGNSLVESEDVAGSAAFVWNKHFPDIIQSGGFDVVVGNPPYVLSRDNTLDQLKDYARKSYKLFTDKINLYLLFIERGLSLLKEDGFMSFIVPNSFLGIESAMKCRDHLVRHTQLRSIVNLLGSTFKGANVEATVFCLKNAPPDDDLVGVATVAEPRDFEMPLSHVPQKEWLTTPAIVFDLRSDSLDRDLLQKLDALPRLEDGFDARAGLQAYEKGKGNPPQTAEDVRTHPFDFPTKYDEQTFPYLQGEDVGRYETKWSGQWLRWGPWLSQPREMTLFTGPRVLIREITGEYPHVLKCTYLDETYLNNKSIINVLPKSPSSDMKYLVGVLNSKVVSFFHTRRAVKGNRTLFPKAVVADVRAYPILVADAAVRASVATNVDGLLQGRKQLAELRRSFSDLLSAEVGRPLGRRFLLWPTLTSADLLKEVKREKITLGLASKAEWLDFHSEKVAEWEKVERQNVLFEREIDRLVAQAYGLTEEERAVLDSSSSRHDA